VSTRVPAWVWTMHQAVGRYAIPPTWGPPIRHGEPIEIHGGSCVAVDLGDSPFLITAAHVVDAAREAVATPGVACVVGRDTELHLSTDDLSVNPALDIATIRLTRDQLARLEAEATIVRPEHWPPPDLREGDPILCIGYPAVFRAQLGQDTIDCRAESRLAFIHALREQEFVCLLDPAYRERRQVGVEELPASDLPGASGGPGFLVRQEPVLVPRLCGIVKQGNILDGCELGSA
jgi:hypothetical protein